MSCFVVMGLLIMPGATSGAELRLQWRTLGPNDREQETTPGALLVVDIYFQMNAGDSLSAMAFSNEYAPSISQVGTAANNGWLDESTDDVLGGVNQLVSFSGATQVGPGEFLIGSQTIRLDDVGDGSAKAIMFSLEPDLRDGMGNSYYFSPFATSTIGAYSIGAGFPDTIYCDPTPCPPDPLIVNIAHPIPDCNGNFVDDSIDVTGGASLDSDGNGWPDECEVNVLFVDEHATGLKYGTSWVDAYTDLRRAFDVAHGTGSVLTEIWVATGTYSPGTSRVAAFRLKSGLAAYGGFVAGETERDERDPLTKATILTGDVARDDGPGFASNDENNFHVVIAIESDPTAALDGFIITAGHANGLDYPHDRGGGLFVRFGSPSLANCTFTRNVALLGGGVYSAWSWNWPFSQSAASILNCSFLGNVASDGAALYNRTSATRLTNSVFSGNAADNLGGAMYNWPGSHTTVTNCTFGGNVAASGGGALYAFGNTRPDITNCIFWQNTPQAVLDFGKTTITYSDVEGGWSGVGNIDVNPVFVDPHGSDDLPGTEDDNLRLSNASRCVNVGDNAAVVSTTDADGLPRIVFGVVDMGAYELQGPFVDPATPKNRYVSLAPNKPTNVVALKVSLTDRACSFSTVCENSSASDIDGSACVSGADCTPGQCVPRKCLNAADCKVCQGGTNAGLACTNNSECPGGTCGVSTETCDEQSQPTILGWVGQPYDPGCRNDDGSPRPDDCAGERAARVVVDPVFRTWPETLVHLGDCEIAPAQSYEISATTDGVVFTSPLTVGTIQKPSGKYWADVVGSFDGVTWTPPDGVVNVNDVQAWVQFKQLAPSAPHATWLDLDGEAPNWVINATDLQFILAGFRSEEYPPPPFLNQGDPLECP